MMNRVHINVSTCVCMLELLTNLVATDIQWLLGMLCMYVHLYLKTYIIVKII
jgi:hypothetical protein